MRSYSVSKLRSAAGLHGVMYRGLKITPLPLQTIKHSQRFKHLVREHLLMFGWVFFFCWVGCFCFYLLNYVVAEERIQNARNRSAAFKNISTRSHDYSHNERDNQIKSGLIPFAPRTEISPLITLASIASSVRPINPLASAGVSAIAQQPTR